MELELGILIPFLGTMLGASMVFLMKDKINNKLEKILLGFASGVMIAASVWSLLIPSIEMAEKNENIAWIPATAGFILGILFLLFLDKLISKLKLKSNKQSKKNTMMILAVTLHNIPEGMAVGVAFAGALLGNTGITMAGATALAIGIAIQNFPEGAIISLPLNSDGISKKKSFFLRYIIWNSGTNRFDNYNYANPNYCISITILIIFCCGSYDLCGC